MNLIITMNLDSEALRTFESRGCDCCDDIDRGLDRGNVSEAIDRALETALYDGTAPIRDYNGNTVGQLVIQDA
jgi:hypothetical protein